MPYLPHFRLSILSCKTFPARLSTVKIPFSSIPGFVVYCKSMSTLSLPNLHIFKAIFEHAAKSPDKPAIVHSDSGKSFSYGQLFFDSARRKEELLKLATGHEEKNEKDLKEKRVAFLVENGYDYVVTLLSIWAAGGIAVPLCTTHPAKEMKYVIDDSMSGIVLSSQKFKDTIKNVMVEGTQSEETKVHTLEKYEPDKNWAERGIAVKIDEESEIARNTHERGGLILYTSGTTSLPKGVLSTHLTINSQSSSLLRAWKYSVADRLLHILPLHHVHGIINATVTPLLAGSTIEFLFPFDPSFTLNRISSSEKDPITLLMAVPTIYSRLINHFNTKLSYKEQTLVSIALSKLRLAISGSAALPTPIKHAWKAISHGEVILERYGMTEIGMALSCGLNPKTERMDNSVGWPLPGYEVRLRDLDTGEVIPEANITDAAAATSNSETGQEEFTKEGELQIRGTGVFRQYFNRPQETTTKEFTPDGYFKTGDVAVRSNRNGAYYIKGRLSTDIIKSGGEKVSALEVEREILLLPRIKEVAVLGLPHEDWGQQVTAIVVLIDSETVKEEEVKEYLEAVRKYLKTVLAPYKVPKLIQTVKTIKRNAMGKVNKKELAKEVFGALARNERN